MSTGTAKPRLLLSACCGPCATVAFVRLSQTYNITVHFWGNNFDTESEYKKRLDALRTVNKLLNGDKPMIIEPYFPLAFENATASLADAPEGGERCKICFKLRQQAAAKVAREQGFDIWTTTLTTSPHKNTSDVNNLGMIIGDEFGAPYLSTDLKRGGGFAESVALSKKFNIYRQNYCGCKYSSKEKNKL